MKCYACDREALMFVKVEMFTVRPDGSPKSDYVEHRLCLPCFAESIDFMKDVEMGRFFRQSKGGNK